MNTTTKLYKVLDKNGRSFHGGNFQYDLPTIDAPGAWHEVSGPVVWCENGFHLTDSPPHWYAPECRIFEVEAEDVQGSCEDTSDRKVVARRVRLLREVTSAADLAACNVFISGTHKTNASRAIAYDSASVEASGSASVRAYDSASVVASGSASVVAYNSASVEAYDSASVEALGSASVVAYGSASVVASGSASVVAYGSASVVASGSASVEALGSASVEASGQVTVVSWKGKEGIKLTERAVLISRSNSSDPECVTASSSPEVAA